MGWSIGYDDNWKRDIGYGVPSICDHPECEEEIDRGLAYVCADEEPYGGDNGCGLYFCGKHRSWNEATEVYCCDRCHDAEDERVPFEPTPDTQEWIDHKITDPSWADWRKENNIVELIQKAMDVDAFFNPRTYDQHKWDKRLKEALKNKNTA